MRTPSERDRDAVAHHVRSEAKPLSLAPGCNAQSAQGRMQCRARLNPPGMQDILHGFVIEQSVRTWLPPVFRLKV